MTNFNPTPDISDPFDLQRFVDAHEEIYAQALAQVRAGRKRTHWMWFVFPQLAGLGSSEMARRYAISSLDEARAYLAHPVLGSRLVEIAAAVVNVKGKSADEIFGSPDDMKLRSCATLFAHVSPSGSVFEQILKQYFDGRGDEKTVQILNRG